MFSLLVVHFMINLLFFFSNSPFLRRKSKNALLLLLIYCRGPFQPAHHFPINLTKFERWGKPGALTRLLLKELFAYREGIPLNRLMISHPLHCLGFNLNIPKLRERDFGIIWNLVILNMNWFCKELLSNVFDFLADLTMITMLLNWLL